MSEPLQLVDRTRSSGPAFNLTTTFNVLVGDMPGPQQLFPVYHDVLTKRSGFLRAARSAQWLKDPQKPVDLKDEDPETFSFYPNCAYFGAQVIRRKPSKCEDSREGKGDKESKEANDETNANNINNNTNNINNVDNVDNINEGTADNNGKVVKKDAFDMFEQDHAATTATRAQQFEYSGSDMEQLDTLIEVYILADKLQDPSTANAVIDEIVNFGEETRKMPSLQSINLAYISTVHGHPLRRLLRDCCLYDISGENYMDVHVDELPLELYRDITVEYLRRKDDIGGMRPVREVYSFNIKAHICYADPCRYHQHDEKYSRCGPKRYDFDRLFTSSNDGW